MKVNFTFYMVHNVETLIFANFRFCIIQSMEILILDVLQIANYRKLGMCQFCIFCMMQFSDKFYNLHGVPCRNLDIWKFLDFALFKIWNFRYLAFVVDTNSIFCIMLNIKSKIFENFRLLHVAKYRHLHFWDSQWRQFHIWRGAKYRKLWQSADFTWCKIKKL